MQYATNKCLNPILLSDNRYGFGEWTPVAPPSGGQRFQLRRPHLAHGGLRARRMRAGVHGPWQVHNVNNALVRSACCPMNRFAYPGAQVWASFSQANASACARATHRHPADVHPATLQAGDHRSGIDGVRCVPLPTRATPYRPRTHARSESALHCRRDVWPRR